MRAQFGRRPCYAMTLMSTNKALISRAISMRPAKWLESLSTEIFARKGSATGLPIEIVGRPTRFCLISFTRPHRQRRETSLLL